MEVNFNFKEIAAIKIIDSCKSNKDILKAFDLIEMYLYNSQDIGGYEQLRILLIEKEKNLLLKND